MTSIETCRVISVLIVFAFNSAFSQSLLPEEDSSKFQTFPGCELIDLAIVLDSSPTIGSKCFRETKKFVKELISKLNVNLQGTRISAIRFTKYVFPLWTFRDSKSRPDMVGWVDRVTYDGKGKRLANALRHTDARTYRKFNGDRSNVPNLAIIFTDGRSRDRPFRRAEILKRKGLRIAAVAIGRNTRLLQLRSLVSSPPAKHVFDLSDFDSVLSLIRKTASGSCPEDWLDEDECKYKNGGCVPPATCTNLPGSRQCVCPQDHEDYTLVNDVICDRDECSNTSLCSYACLNTPGSYVCLCPPGESLLEDGYTCDFNECAIKNGNCTALATCVNTLGSSRCDCRNGYILIGNDCDIDECALNNGGCSHHCVNTLGSYSCACPQGFVLGNENKNCAKCGFDAEAGKFTRPLTSPGWPFNYRDDITCNWKLRARPGYRVKIVFEYLGTELCCDYLAIQNNNIETHRLRGFMSNISIVSESSEVSLTFYSDENVNESGFKAIFLETQETSSAPCGFSSFASKESKDLASPNWPRSYLPHQDCDWTISSQIGHRIEVNFSNFLTEDCCDYLDIYEDGKEVVRLKGDVSFLQPYISTTNKVVMKFQSNDEVQLMGFFATFKQTLKPPSGVDIIRAAPCGFTDFATNFSATLSSPGWPAMYDDNLDCQWRLSARPGYRIMIKIFQFKTERCCDYLLINDGSISTLLNGTLSPGSLIISSKNSLILSFHSDISVGDIGFLTTFRGVSARLG